MQKMDDYSLIGFFLGPSRECIRNLHRFRAEVFLSPPGLPSWGEAAFLGKRNWDFGQSCVFLCWAPKHFIFLHIRQVNTASAWKKDLHPMECTMCKGCTLTIKLFHLPHLPDCGHRYCGQQLRPWGVTVPCSCLPRHPAVMVHLLSW